MDSITVRGSWPRLTMGNVGTGVTHCHPTLYTGTPLNIDRDLRLVVRWKEIRVVYEAVHRKTHFSPRIGDYVEEKT